MMVRQTIVNTRNAGLTVDQATSSTIGTDLGVQLSKDVIAETPQESLNIVLNYKDNNSLAAEEEVLLFDPLQYLDK